MARQRNYPAEYRRRKQLGAARGLSTAQARGHARADEVPISELRRHYGYLSGREEETREKVYRAVGFMRQGNSLSQAAKMAGTTPETVKRYNREVGNELFGKTYKREYESGKRPAFAGWGFGGEIRSFWLIDHDGNTYKDVPMDEKNRSLMGRYWNEVDNALEGKPNNLHLFAGTVIYDIHGTRYHLATDINLIRFSQWGWADEEMDKFQRGFSAQTAVQYAA